MDEKRVGKTEGSLLVGFPSPPDLTGAGAAADAILQRAAGYPYEDERAGQERLGQH
jgi:hypothetical protein